MSGTSFSSVNTPSVKRSYQNLSFEIKTSMNFGFLCPVYIQDVIPGDKFNVGAEIFTRCFPLLSPVMHRADIYLHFFFVPNRLVWHEWEEFITLGPDGTSQPVPPSIRIGLLYARGLFGVGSLADYMYMPVDDGVLENSLPRMYSRRQVLDYAFPVFAHLGEQEVLNKELWLSTSSDWNDGVFGYQERYAEYRFSPNRSTGQFRTSLLYWSIDRRFSSRPALNETFINCAPRYDIFPVANESEHHFIIQIYFSVHARRPLPKVGDPGYIDHF